jgi:hypothetical protein
MPERLHVIAAGIEGATGIALIADPQMVARLLLGHELDDTGKAVARVAGIALLALGLACWPPRGGIAASPNRALITYNSIVALYLLGIGLEGEIGGKLLWPAVALHALMTLLLIRASFTRGRARPRGLSLRA